MRFRPCVVKTWFSYHSKLWSRSTNLRTCAASFRENWEHYPIDFRSRNLADSLQQAQREEADDGAAECRNDVLKANGNDAKPKIYLQ